MSLSLIVSLLTCGMQDCRRPHITNALTYNAMASFITTVLVSPNFEMVSTIINFLSPRASKPLSPVCTLTQSPSSTSIATTQVEKSIIQIPDATYVSPYLQKDYNSNQRTRNQFRPRNTTKGTTSYQLRQYAEATLGGGSLRKIVKLPEGEDENEWLAVNSKHNELKTVEYSLTVRQWWTFTITSICFMVLSQSSALHNRALK